MLGNRRQGSSLSFSGGLSGGGAFVTHALKSSPSLPPPPPLIGGQVARVLRGWVGVGEQMAGVIFVFFRGPEWWRHVCHLRTKVIAIAATTATTCRWMRAEMGRGIVLDYKRESILLNAKRDRKHLPMASLRDVCSTSSEENETHATEHLDETTNSRRVDVEGEERCDESPGAKLVGDGVDEVVGLFEPVAGRGSARGADDRGMTRRNMQGWHLGDRQEKATVGFIVQERVSALPLAAWRVLEWLFLRWQVCLWKQLQQSSGWTCSQTCLGEGQCANTQSEGTTGTTCQQTCDK
jgi:hypothetical protein